MNTNLLKRNYDLEIPSSYAEVTRDEMEYVDGGYRTSRQTWVKTQTLNIRTLDWAIGTSIADIAVGITIAAITGGSAILFGTKKAILSTVFGSGITGIGSWSDAYELDKDGDGWITRDIKGHYRTEFNPYPMHSYEGARF